MSVFFAILKGPYDGLLRWPFTCPVRITLVDQAALQAAVGTAAASGEPSSIEETGKDVVRTFVPNPRPENVPFLGRPADQRNMSLGEVLRRNGDIKYRGTLEDSQYRIATCSLYILQ